MSSLRSAATLAVVLISGLAPEAFATKFWKNSVTSGAWSVGGNWSAVSAAGADNGGVPTLFEATNIVTTNGVARTVTLDVSPPTLGLLSLDLTGAGTAANTLNVASNVSLTAGQGFGIGGYNGSAFTNGRGAVNQSAGNVTVSPGVDLIMAWGAGSSGQYTLSGGALSTTQSQWVGFAGTGLFNHTGGTNTLNPSGVGFLSIGNNVGASGTYNLSGASATLTSNHNVFVGAQGTGLFNHSAGTNTLVGLRNLILGDSATGNGAYNLTGGQLTVGGNLQAGNNGVGVLTIGPSGNAFVNNTLSIGAQGTVNLNGGTLRLSGYSRVAAGTLNYNSGTVRFAGSRELRSDPVVTAFFPGGIVPAGKKLVVESMAFPEVFTVDGGEFQSLGATLLGWNGDNETFRVQNGGTATSAGVQLGASNDRSGSATVTGSGSTWNTGELRVGQLSSGELTVSGAATVNSTEGYVGSPSNTVGVGTAVVTGAGSLWDVDENMVVGLTGFGSLRVSDQAVVSVGTELILGNAGSLELDGGRLRFADYQPDPSSVLRYYSGAVQMAGNRSLGIDPDVQAFFGAQPSIPFGKELYVEGTATIASGVTLRGGTLTAGQLVGFSNLDFQQGTLRLTNQAVTVGAGGLFGTALDVRAGQRIDLDLGLTNAGLVSGDGQLGGAFANAPGGVLRAEPGRSLTLTGAATNDGSVQLLGGALDFQGGLVNNAAGTITGNGSLVASALTNHGLMNLAGTTNIVGAVTNSATGKIVSGGGGATIFFDDVINSGEVRTSSSGFTVFFGDVSGAGVFTGTGTVNFEGTMSPGASPAAVSFAGDVVFGEESTLAIEIGGTTPGAQFDRLVVAGDLTLNGELNVALSNGFVPTAGQSFDLLDWGATTGAFSSITLPALPGRAWNTSQLYTTGVLSVVSAGLPGDANGDGAVDLLDLDILGANFGSSPATLAQGDFNGDNAVDLLDLDILGANFGAGPAAATGPTAAIPEPATLVYVALAALFARKPR